MPAINPCANDARLVVLPVGILFLLILLASTALVDTLIATPLALTELLPMASVYLSDITWLLALRNGA